jgi:glutamyl-tRNA synthetase/glutamyl-Q tRNA(Asp) synthetase
VVNAIYVWGIARATGGRVLLRIEDHDRIRSRPEYEAALLEDLDWLGFVPDDGRDPVARQSDEVAAYQRALDGLRSHYQVYACDCSRRDVGSEVYHGRCRERGLRETSGRGLRVRIEPGKERFDDCVLGSLHQAPADQCGDMLVKDRDGHWTYQFAVTVDDARQDITLVIRGMDLLSSTGRQIRLARMLGRRDPPHFLHHPLIIGPGGEKLSKSRHDTGVRELRRSGLSAADVIGRAAAAVGLLSEPRPVDAGEVARLFEA